MWRETDRPAVGDGGPQMGQCRAANVHIPIIDEEIASCQAPREAVGTVEDILALAAELDARSRICRADGDEAGFARCRQEVYRLQKAAWEQGCRP